MNKSDAIQEIKDRYADYLRPAKKQGTYICPLCQNGTGSAGDGISVKGTHLKCFKCGFGGDLIDLYQKETGADFNGAVAQLAATFGISIGVEREWDARQAQKRQEPQEEPIVQEVQDLTGYYRECRDRIAEVQEYLSFRGISVEMAAAYRIGFDPEWRSPTAIRNGKNPPTSPRLIIPTSGSSYIARDIRPDAKNFTKMKEGSAKLFNVKALYNEEGRAVFITEGEIDALSIIEVGGFAMGLGSTSNKVKLLKKLTENRTSATLILCLDNDDPGRKASRELAEGLKKLNISYVTADICGGRKDPNEALTADRGAFTRSIQEAEHSTAAKPDAVGDYINRLMAGEIDRFKEGASRKTGFENLDTKAGGVYPGL